MDNLKEYYKILELPPYSSLENIKQAYRDLVKVWHPDRFPGDTRMQSKANQKLAEINKAYKILCEHGPASHVKTENGTSQTTVTQGLAKKKFMIYVMRGILLLMLIGVFTGMTGGSISKLHDSQPQDVTPDSQPLPEQDKPVNKATYSAANDFKVASMVLGGSNIQQANALFGNPLEINASGKNEKPPLKYYRYKSIELYTIDDAGGKDKIVCIKLTSPEYPTNRGIRVGDNITKVHHEYGPTLEKLSNSPDYRFYPNKNKADRILFSVNSKGLVEKISFTLLPLGSLGM